MIIDLTNVDTLTYLDEEGIHTLKVVKVDESKYTINGNKILEITLKTKDEQIYIQQFVVTDKALWSLKLFTKALKMPDVVNTDEMVGRYVKGDFRYEAYTKKDGTVTKMLKCIRWMPSDLTECTPHQEQPRRAQPPKQQEMDIADEDIPF